MACFSAAEIARIKARIATKEAQLAALNAAFLAASGKNVESYKFDDLEGSQWVKNRDLDDMLESISTLESEIDALYARLRAGGLVKVNLRMSGQRPLGC